MKKLFGTISALLAAAVLFAGCSGGETAESVLKEGQSDIQYIKDKGTFIIGITDYAPMDFKDGDKWTGFDAELSTALAEERNSPVCRNRLGQAHRAPSKRCNRLHMERYDLDGGASAGNRLLSALRLQRSGYSYAKG